MTEIEAPLKVTDFHELFDQPAYVQQAQRKRAFEAPCDEAELARVRAWTKTGEYRELNFARTALTVNPAKACQPLGALLAALGFAGTLPLVHGSQGCNSYFRSHLTRHFREPTPSVSSAMTEDGAVFGGMSNFIEALDNAMALYQPDMIAVSTTCMAEVIGDDLQNFIANARAKGVIGQDFPVAFAHTPSFVGSHIIGYDAMLRGILTELTRGRNGTPNGTVNGTTKGTPNGTVNIVPGFVTNVGDLREIKRLLGLIGVDHVILGDHSDTFDSPATGDYPMYPGGTPLDVAADAVNATATVFLQEFATRKTAEMIATEWGQETTTVPYPLGIANTDRFVMSAAAAAGVGIPDDVRVERGRLVDAMADSYACLHGKRVALAGDPDMVCALLGFLLELGIEPVHVVSTNGDEAFASRARQILDASPFGRGATVWPGKDLWHLRSLVFTEPVDLLIGDSHLKYLAREAGVPLVRFGFPIFDRHHLHRFSILGYAGGVRLVADLANTVLEEMDRTSSLTTFDLLR